MKKTLALTLTLIIVLPLMMAAFITDGNAEERVEYDPGQGWFSSDEMMTLIQAVSARPVEWIYCRENPDDGSFTLEVQYEAGRDQIYLAASEVMIVLRANGEQTVDYSLSAVVHVLGFVALGRP